ncbi:hypothetical protein NOCARDAX2BIS_150079 [Nocardioides sp. AX2bis]|nr:hypothetical protein NOCARDAX2BIS_150079 [Nocardioides sp. AX2bis]
MAHGVPGRGGGDPFPLEPLPHPVDLLAGRAAGAAARRRGRPPPARRPRQGRARGLPPGHPQPRRPGGAAAGLRRADPGRAPRARLVLLLGVAVHPVRAVGLPAHGARAAHRAGPRDRLLAREAGPGRGEPVRRRGHQRPLAAHGAGDRDRPPPRGGHPGPGGAGGLAPLRSTTSWRGAGRDRGRPDRRVGRRDRAPAHRGARRPRRLPGGVAAVVAVGDLARAAARGPRGLRPRPRPADAPAPGARGPVRHPVPRLGRGALRPAAPARPRRPAGAGRHRDRGRRRPRRARRRLRAQRVRRAGAALRGAVLRARAGRPGRARSDRRGVRGAGRRAARLPAGRLEDEPHGERRPVAARGLPPGLGRAARAGTGAGAGRVLLRPHQPAGRAPGPARAHGAGGPAQPVGLRSPRRSSQAATARAAARPARVAPIVLADGP